MADPAGTITIDASGSTGIDFETFIRAGFLSDATSGGFPVFDNSAAFAGEEMLISYGGTAPADKYVLAHGQIEYFFGTHTVHGEINRIEYGTRGTGSYDANGYFVGGSAQLVITGLELANAVAPEAEVEANGPVHNFAVANMSGASASPTRLDTYADSLDAYAQVFIGSSGGDLYVATEFKDTMTGGAGDDTLGGGDGEDTAIFSGNAADYTIGLKADGSFSVLDTNAGDGDDGTDLLSGIEKLQFADQTLDAPENQAPTGLALSGALALATITTFAHETLTVGSVLGTLSATDPEGGALTFSLTGDASGNFEIVGTELRLKSGLDYESGTSHVIEVTAKDEAGNTSAQEFTVQVRDDVEDQEGTLTIDASALGAAGINFTSFISNYFAGIGKGSPTFYGGTADPNPFGPPGSITYQNGTQIGLRYGSNSQQVLIDGDDLNYNYIHHGKAYSHGITGDVEQITLGRYDGTTVPSTPEDGTNGPGELTNVLQAVTFSGFDLGAAPGAGFNPADNVVYRIYNSLNTGNASDIYELLSHYAQSFKGTTGNDVFIGSKLADTIDGNGGLDFLIGGQGGDNYVVDSADDYIIENEDGGIDLVKSANSRTLGTNLENLTLIGSATDAIGNAFDNEITGNGSDNLLDGLAGGDKMAGAGGNDTYVVDSSSDLVIEIDGGGADLVKSSITYALLPFVENLALTGTADTNGTGNGLKNDILGNSGSNKLDGGADIDTLSGGAGNDYYSVDNSSDLVKENAEEGIDTVNSSASYILGDNVEHLSLRGTGNISGTGNGANNNITGNSGGNALRGYDGADTLSGGAGADTMWGGIGDDIYVVDSSGDRVLEVAGQGTADMVRSSIDYTLDAAVENLALLGANDISGTGSNFNNAITGNNGANLLSGVSGADSLVGGQGSDTLHGGAGADKLNGGAQSDTFLFKTLNDSRTAMGIDTIYTFTTEDVIDLQAIDAVGNVANDQAFAFIGAAAFSGAAGQLRYAGGTIEGDINGDKNADLIVVVNGSPAVTGDDFIL